MGENLIEAVLARGDEQSVRTAHYIVATVRQRDEEASNALSALEAGASHYVLLRGFEAPRVLSARCVFADTVPFFTLTGTLLANHHPLLARNCALLANAYARAYRAAVRLEQDAANERP